MNQEIELKYRLPDRAALERVQKTAQHGAGNPQTELLLQTNTFFDASDLRLKTNSLSFRLRLENKQAILCIKGNNPKVPDKQDNLSVRLEYESKLPAAIAKEILKGEVSPLEYLLTLQDSSSDMKRTREYLCKEIKRVLQKEELVVVGSFNNERLCIPIEINGIQLKLELDQTQFTPDVTHYEVELEIPPTLSLKKAEKYLSNLLKAAKVPLATSKSKSDRFYGYLSKNLAKTDS